MKKETVIAIIFGIALGGAVALFILLKGKDIELAKNKMIAPKIVTQDAAAKPASVSFQPLEVTTPENGIITDKNTVKVAGKIQKGSLLVVQSPVNDTVIVAESNNFEFDLPLALGENIVKLVAYPKDKTIRAQEKDLKIYYLDSEL